MRRHVSGALPANGSLGVHPALLTSTSRRPSAVTASPTAASTRARSVTSATSGSARRPRARTSVAASPAALALVSSTATSAPAAASASAIPSPIPWPPPVTSAAWPASSGRPTASAPTEVGLPLLPERAQPLRAVLGAEELRGQSGLERQRRLQRHRHPDVDRGLGEPEPERGALRVEAAHLERGVELGARGHDPVDEADPERLRSVDRLRREQQLLRAPRPDEARQPLGAAGARDGADARA